MAIYILRNYMATLPKTVIESAKIDGATHYQTFYRLVLPMSVPALASFAIFQFLSVWNDLLVALVFIGPGNNQPVTVALTQLKGQLGQGWELTTAGGFVTLILPVIVFLALQRFFIRRLTTTARSRAEQRAGRRCRRTCSSRRQPPRHATPPQHSLPPENRAMLFPRQNMTQPASTGLDLEWSPSGLPQVTWLGHLPSGVPAHDLVAAPDRYGTCRCSASTATSVTPGRICAGTGSGRTGQPGGPGPPGTAPTIPSSKTTGWS